MLVKKQHFKNETFIYYSMHLQCLSVYGPIYELFLNEEVVLFLEPYIINMVQFLSQEVNCL